jgi:mRNA interferase YafQ
MLNLINTKYEIEGLKSFQKNFKKIVKQGKDINKFKKVLSKLANKETLEQKYKDHKLIDNKYFKDCRECHIEPDWLLVYKYLDDRLILVLVDTGSHSEVFK